MNIQYELDISCRGRSMIESVISRSGMMCPTNNSRSGRFVNVFVYCPRLLVPWAPYY